MVITYLTAVPSGSSIVYFDDIYGRDAQRLAQLGGGSGARPLAASASGAGSSRETSSMSCATGRPCGSRAGRKRT